MAKILLIDDDQHVREALRISLEEFRHQVLEAPNGREAKTIYLSNEFDLIISDVQMPFMNGVEFLQWLRGEKYQTPFIMITGFSHLLETKSALEMGAQGFLAKPFSRLELKSSLDDIFKKDEVQKPVVPVENYCKIRIEEFVADQKIDYPLFIKIGSKFVKIAHEGGKIDPSKAQIYKEKGLEFLWVLKSDFKKVIGFNLHVAKALQKTSSVPFEKKQHFLRHTADIILEQVYMDEIDANSFDYAKDFLSLSVEAFTEDDECFQVMNILETHADFLYTHSLGVSLFSVMLAKKIGWHSLPTLHKVGLAGLMHDIGKKEIPREILEKSRAELKPDEIKLIESHCVRGRDILTGIRSIPVEVIEAAHQHHELSHGGGYPNGYTDNKIFPIAKVIAITDRFCKLTLKAPNSPQLPAYEALSRMQTDERDFNVPYFRKFVELFKENKKKKAA